MKPNVAVVIPTYKAELTPLEEISLAQCRKVLGNYPLIFIAPEGKIFPYFKPGDGIVHFPAHYFQSVQTYNQLMAKSFFYATFREFDYILIYQPDAFVFYDALEEFCCLGYDYIGAPWPRMYRRYVEGILTLHVGNGGFTLRNVRACQRIVTEHADLVERIILSTPEDIFFSYCGKVYANDFRVAPIEIAYKFSAEFHPARVVKKNDGVLPFGCHGWQIYDSNFYVETFARFGYDLLPFRNMLNYSDGGLRLWLTKLTLSRLIRRAEHGLPVSHYLPIKRFASIRVFRDVETMKVLSQLIAEENSLTDKIFVYAKSDCQAMVNDLPCDDLPHMILTMYDDGTVIDLLESRGLIYGRHVISYRREVLNWYEKFFRNLGKH